MLRTRSLVLLLVAAAAACSAPAESPLAPVSADPASALGDPPRKVRVTHAGDSGPGSFRAALEEASADPAVVGITFNPDIGAIAPASSLTFTGIQALTIDGNNAWISGFGCVGDLLVFNTSASVSLMRMTVSDANDGVAVRVNVAASAVGTLNVSLNAVNLFTNRRHALLVHDRAGIPIDSATASPAGSAASLRVDIIASMLHGNVFDEYLMSGPNLALPDQDAVRINEGGDGDVVLNVRGSEFYMSGGDDIQVEEHGNGSADLRVETTQFNSTGIHTSAGTGDAIRVDEHGAGNVSVRGTTLNIYDGRGQAIEAYENGAGDLYLYTSNASIHGGHEAARVIAKEDAQSAGGGNLTVDLVDSFIGLGPWTPVAPAPAPERSLLLIHEAGEGSADLRLTRSGVNYGTRNGGILVREDAGGNLRATFRGSSTSNNRHHGAMLDENGAGDLTATFTGGYFFDNGGAVIDASQEAPGVGNIALTANQILNNTGPTGNAVVTSGAVTVRYY